MRLYPMIIGWLCVLPSIGSAQDRTVIQAGKEAVALVESTDKNATAFCIDTTGYFVTNYHVIKDLRPDAKVKLIVRSSELDEWSLTAKTILVDQENDLAILKSDKVPGDKKLQALELSTNPNLYETMNLIAFGFPFGKQLTVDKDANPSVSVSVGKLTAMRKEKGEIQLIQLDATLNPGNSGGPVIDEKGKVVGIVSFGVLASGVNFAVPVEKLWAMLRKPFLDIEAGGLAKDPYVPSDIRITVSSIQKEIKDPSVEFWIKRGDSEEKKISLESKDGSVYQGSVSAVEDDPTQMVLKGRFLFREGELRGRVLNEQLAIGDRKIWISTIESIKLSEDGKIGKLIMQDGSTVDTDLASLPQVKIDFGGFTTPVQLSQILSMELQRPMQERLSFRVVVKSEGKEIYQRRIDDEIDLSTQLAVNETPTSDGDAVVDSRNLELGRGNTRVRSKYEGKEKSIAMPGIITDVVRAGDGRYLLVSLADSKKLVIVDLASTSIVKVLPLPSQNSITAATIDQFFIFDREKQILESYLLDGFSRQSASKLPYAGIVKSMTAGESSRGLLLVGLLQGKELQTKHRWLFLDSYRLKEYPITLVQGQEMRIDLESNLHVRAAANGKVFAMWESEQSMRGMQVGVLSDKEFQVKFANEIAGHAQPTADGANLLTGNRGVVSPMLYRMEPVWEAKPPLFATTHPQIYLSIPLDNQGPSNTGQRDVKKVKALIRQVNAEAPLAEVPDVYLGSSSSRFSKPMDDFTLDKRVFMDVEAGMILSIPFANDQILIQPFDLSTELKTSSGDYFFVSSSPDREILPGRFYSCQLKVETNQQDVGFELISGPEGMEITDTGKVTWKVPKDFTERTVDVIISVTSGGEHQAFESFSLRNTKGR